VGAAGTIEDLPQLWVDLRDPITWNGIDTRTIDASASASACALLLHFGLSAVAYSVEETFLAAVLALALGGFCLGSFVYQLFRGRGAFARF
jgi:hypothetical protein